jgi:hypothetical protein
LDRVVRFYQLPLLAELRYIPPLDRSALECYKDLLIPLCKRSRRVIVCGDFKLAFGDSRDNGLAQGMLDLIDSFALSVHNTHGIRTHVGDISSSDSILDLTLSTAAASSFDSPGCTTVYWQANAVFSFATLVVSSYSGFDHGSSSCSSCLSSFSFSTSSRCLQEGSQGCSFSGKACKT